MKIPPNKTEQEVVDIIYKVVNTLANKFKFGYLSAEDIRQEGARFAIEALNGTAYDPARPLENFLYVHVRNRLINYKRDHYSRSEPPCQSDDDASRKRLDDWAKRNAAKQSLMRPLDVSLVNEDVCEADGMVVEDAALSEIHDLIDKDLPAELRSDYLRMLSGFSIPKVRKDRVREAIISIWKESNYSGT